jgi:hypothetical protein
VKIQFVRPSYSRKLGSVHGSIPALLKSPLDLVKRRQAPKRHVPDFIDRHGFGVLVVPNVKPLVRFQAMGRQSRLCDPSDNDTRFGRVLGAAQNTDPFNV